MPTSLPDEAALERVLGIVEAKDWIADIEGTPPEYRGSSENQHVFGYLAKYVSGVAIGDSRLISVSAEAVVFEAKDYRDKTHVQVSRPPEEFCYWFSRHILPRGIPRTRYAGCYAPTVREKYLALCRKLWKEAHPESSDVTSEQRQGTFIGETDEEETAEEEAYDYRCKKCDGRVDLGEHMDGTLTVALLAVARWVVQMQREQTEVNDTAPEHVPHWRNVLAEVIRQHVASACRNSIIQSIRSGLIRPDEHWLSLFVQAIEWVAEQEAELTPTSRPP